MAVKRIVANIAVERPGAAKSFYGDILGMALVMDEGMLQTYAAAAMAPAQVTMATHGGSGAQVPDLTVEVDNFAEVLQRVKAAGLALEYGPKDEPWGVRRFFVRDPFGRLINIMTHI